MALPTTPTGQDLSLGRSRILIHGQPGTGKTTLASGFPAEQTLVLDFDDAWRLLPGERFRVSPRNFAEVHQLVVELTTGQHQFRTVIVDTITRMWRLADLEAGSRYGKNAAGVVEFGKGTSDRDGTLMRVLAPLFASDLGVVLLAHSQPKADTPDEDKALYPVIDKKIYDDVVGGVDYVFSTVRQPDGQHLLLTGANAHSYTKSRFPLQHPIPLTADPSADVTNLRAAIAAAANPNTKE